MKTQFQLDGVYSMTVDSNPPRDVSDAARSVWIQIDKTPLPTMSMDDEFAGFVQGPTEVIASFGIRPGEARTIASALMTAAQSAR